MAKQYEIENFDRLLQQDYIKKMRELLARRYEAPPLALVQTFGCAQNVSDGEKLQGMLALMGYGVAQDCEEAQVVIYNTCAIRENAEDRVFGRLGILSHAKKENPGMVIAVCGCMAQQEHTARKIRESYPFVDLVFGPHVLHKLPEMLYRVLTGERRIFDLSEGEDVIVEGVPVRRSGDVKAGVPIMSGCDNFCSYCVVPYVRGRERSRAPEYILEEVRRLAQSGVKEITLLGQNVNSYGKGLPEPVSFARLLAMVDKVPGDFRIRFMTSHPKDCTRELIDVIAASEKVCRHIHLPVQSGSDRILALMNRHYTAARYLELVDYARKVIPDVAFSSDIIVGFPGETEEDFRATLDLVERVRYNALFTFIYSPRQGTKAAGMEDPTPEKEKSQRLNRLLELQAGIGAENYRRMVGKTVRVLADGPSKAGGGLLTGHTDESMVADFPGDLSQVGQFVMLRVTQALGRHMVGEPV